MYLVDVENINEDFYKNSIPIFTQKNITYLRNEKMGYKSCYSKAAPFFNEILINGTAYEILKLCNGERSPQLICEEAKKIFTGVNEEVLEKDLKQVLFQYSKTSLIDWKEGKNPFMNNYKKNINENFKLEIANETQLIKLTEFFEKKQKTDNLKYLNPSRNFLEYTDELIYREKLFMYSEEFILLTNKNDEVEGVFSILIPSIRNASVKTASVSAVGVVDMPKDFIGEAINFIKEIITDIAVNDIKKIKYSSIVNDENNEELKDILINNGFKSEAILEKECGNQNLEIVSYIY